ncbi:MAG: dynamin family protein [Limnochordales bacterium]
MEREPTATFDPAWIDDALQLLQRSPLRRPSHPSRSMPAPFAQEVVEDIPRRVRALKERLSKPLTLAVLGEVKAGKSTLVNALVGADVAPVDVLEATQWIMEIRAADEPYGQVLFADGSTHEGTPQEIHDLLYARRHDAAFVQRCAAVVVGLPWPALARWHLIDTPGLATVTQEAAARTQQHLTQVDAVLWVLNAHHLGQADVTAELAAIARQGKPVLAVINRIDEVDADPARLVRYVRMRLGEYVQDVFAVSAHQARQAQRAGDDALLQASGLPALQAYLQARITGRAAEAQAEALGQQLLALLQLEETVHETYGHQLTFLLQEAENHYQRLELERQRIQKEAEHFVESQLEGYLYDVAHRFTGHLSAGSRWDALLRSGQPSIDEEALASALAGDGFRAWVEGLGPQVDAFIREKWQEATGQMQLQLRERFQAFYAGEVRRLEGIEDLGGPSDLIEGLKEGLTAGGVIGTGLAAYAAALGPAAAYITLGSALGMFLPPALVIGAGAGVVLRLLRSNQQAERLRTSLRDAIVAHQRRLRAEWLKPTVFPALYRHNAAVADTLHRAFLEQLCQGWSLEELQALAQAAAAHGQQCRRARERLARAMGLPAA